MLRIEAPVIPASEFKIEWFIDNDPIFHLNRQEVEKSVDQIFSPEQKTRFRNQIIAEWLYQMSLVLDDYEVVRAGDFIGLSPSNQCETLINYCLRFQQETKSYLSAAACESFEYPIPIVCFHNLDLYYHHILPFYPEEQTEIADSDGIFMGDPAFHQIAIVDESVGGVNYVRTLAYNISHLQLAHLELPKWVAEGLSQAIQEALVGCQNVDTLTIREWPKKNREVWKPENFQEFWSGWAFSNPELQECAYYFSRVLINLIQFELCNNKQEFIQFISEAKFEDGGEQAFVSVFGQSLGVLVEEILGGKTKDWQPRPE